MRFRFASLAVLGVAAVVGCSDDTSTDPARGPLFAAANAGSKTYVVIANGNELPAGLSDAAAAAGGSITGTMAGIGVAVASSSDPNFASALERTAGVQAVVEDIVLDFEQPTVAPEMVEAGEPDVGQASHVGSTESFRLLQWAPDAISAPAAWHAGFMGAGVRVAILDGGIRNTHVDIAPRLDASVSTSFVPGQVYNFDTGTFWHGTHVAGIVAAAANNIGTVGIAPQATLIGVKVLHNGSGAFSWVMQGIYYAATPIAEGGAGADIINMSLGAGIQKRGAGVAQLLNALSRATSYANQRGVAVIAAAGNAATFVSGDIVFVPASSVGVIGVSATAPVGWKLGATNFDDLASYSNFGHQVVDFAGPGGDDAYPGNEICSVPRIGGGANIVNPCWVFDLVMAPCRGSGTSNSTYCWAAGTSMASPAVAGVAALILGKNGKMHPAQLEAALRASADDLGKPGQDDTYGDGRVNAWRAVQ